MMDLQSIALATWPRAPIDYQLANATLQAACVKSAGHVGRDDYRTGIGRSSTPLQSKTGEFTTQTFKLAYSLPPERTQSVF